MTYKTEKEAEAAGNRLLRKMKSKGWKLRVWDNLGWHASISNGPLQISICPDGGYVIFMSDDVKAAGGDCGIWHFDGQYGRDPNKLVRKKLENAYKGVRPYVQSIIKVEQILETEK